MKSIQLNRGTLDIPTALEELTEQQRIEAFSLLFQLFTGSITPLQFKSKLLIYITGYKSSRVHVFKSLLILLFRGKEKYYEWQSFQQMRTENIRFNLIRLSQELELLFSMDENKIIPDHYFLDNPFRSSFQCAAYFTRNITVETDITAKEFSDCMDLMFEANNNESEPIQEHCTNKITAILLRIDFKESCTLPFGIRFGMLCWFQSIAYFFHHHPVYSILYNRAKKQSDDDDNKINLGMSETMLYLKKEGYAHSEEMNVVDFFNAQVKSLRDSLSSAIASGMELDKLSAETGLSIYDINRLT